MLKNIAFYSIAIFVLLSSCHSPDGNKAVIQGTLTDAAGEKLTLMEMDVREIHPLDSTVLDPAGMINFHLAVKEPGFWLLKAKTGKILVILVHPGDQVMLSGSARDFPDQIRLNGSEEAIRLNDFFTYTRKNEHQVDSLEILLVERQDSADYFQLTQKLDTAFRMIWERQRSFEMDFINRHPGSLASLIVLNYAFGLNAVLSPLEDLGYFEKTDSALMKTYPGNKHVMFHHERVLEYQRKGSEKK